MLGTVSVMCSRSVKMHCLNEWMKEQTNKCLGWTTRGLWLAEGKAKKHRRPRGDYDSPALSEPGGESGEYWQDLAMEWMLGKGRAWAGQRRLASLDARENHETNNRNREIQASERVIVLFCCILIAVLLRNLVFFFLKSYHLKKSLQWKTKRSANQKYSFVYLFLVAIPLRVNSRIMISTVYLVFTLF